MIKVSRFEVGGGLGAQKLKIIVVFDDGKLLDRAASGTLHYGSGVQAGAGTASTGIQGTTSHKSYHAFQIAVKGAVATVTISVACFKHYLD